MFQKEYICSSHQYVHFLLKPAIFYTSSWPEKTSISSQLWMSEQIIIIRYSERRRDRTYSFTIMIKRWYVRCTQFGPCPFIAES